MEEAIWEVIGPYVPQLAGILLALYLIAAVYIALLDGLRVDRWAIFRRKGIMKSIDNT